MGIFTRFRDIVGSNISAMLDRAEDPEKLIKLMIREMEDTLIELKAFCAGVLANSKKIQRQMVEAQSRSKYWKEKAAMAVNRGRDDLAREALVERRRYADAYVGLERELAEHNVLQEQYQEDIKQLQEKLGTAREKERLLVQRHIRAIGKIRAEKEIRRMDSSDAIFKFEELENRIERMEAEADLINFGTKPDLEEELESLGLDDEIEAELQTLKSSRIRKEEGEDTAYPA